MAGLADQEKRVQFEQPYEGSVPYGMVTVIFGLSLFMVSDALGWPDAAPTVELPN